MRSCVPLTLLSLLTFFTASSRAEDWFRFRGPQLNGVSEETHWLENWPEDGPKVAWEANVGTGFSAVVVSEGRLYTLGNRDNVDTVVCLDCQTGAQIWKHDYVSPTDANEFEGGPTSTPTVAGNDVLTLGRRGELFCFEKATGSVRWAINVAEVAEVRVPAWGFAGSPLVLEDRVILNVGDAGTAIDRETGKLLWKSADKDSGYSSPIPDASGQQVILGSARSYVGVDHETGREIWRQRWLTTFGCNAADPIVRGKQVFLSSGYNRGAALLRIDSAGPTVEWKHKEMQNQLCSSVLIDGHLYGIHGDVASGGKLRCLEWESGKTLWTHDRLRAGALSAAANHLLVLSDSGELVVGKAASSGFDVWRRVEVLEGKCWTAPVISGGRIFCRSAIGDLVCLDLR